MGPLPVWVDRGGASPLLRCSSCTVRCTCYVMQCHGVQCATMWCGVAAPLASAGQAGVCLRLFAIGVVRREAPHTARHRLCPAVCFCVAKGRPSCTSWPPGLQHGRTATCHRYRHTFQNVGSGMHICLTKTMWTAWQQHATTTWCGMLLLYWHLLCACRESAASCCRCFCSRC